MADVILNFDEDGQLDFEPLPNGVYTVKIDASDAKEIKTAGTGTAYITLKFTVIEGEYKGRVVFQDYYLTDKARKFLTAVFRAAGVEGKGEKKVSTNSLHGKTIKVRLKQEARDDGSMRNRVVAAMPADSPALSGSSAPSLTF